MKERPIIFSAPMVRAILDGRKTQTRRIIKPQPPADAVHTGIKFNAQPPSTFIWTNDRQSLVGDAVCQYGRPGDRLWVRETFCNSPDGIIYRSTEHEHGMLEPDDHCIWKPSIHMPRSASRITLEITKVRVERLQDINEDDAQKEGIWQIAPGLFVVEGEPGLTSHSNKTAKPIDVYAALWDEINGPGSWAANPWVWVICFKRMEDAHA